MARCILQVGMAPMREAQTMANLLTSMFVFLVNKWIIIWWRVFGGWRDLTWAKTKLISTFWRCNTERFVNKTVLTVWTLRVRQINLKFSDNVHIFFFFKWCCVSAGFLWTVEMDPILNCLHIDNCDSLNYELIELLYYRLFMPSVRHFF